MPVPFGAPATPRPQTATAGNRTRVETLGGFHHATRPRLLLLWALLMYQQQLW